MSATLRVTDFTENENLFLVPPPVVEVLLPFRPSLAEYQSFINS